MTSIVRQLFAVVVLVVLSAAPIAAASGQVSPTDVRDLPLVEVPATGGSPTHIAIVLSGDGGWRGLVRTMSARLAENGVGVVGFNARSYLSRAKTPEQSAADVARVLRHYEERWKATRFVIVGYSRGADMAPFVYNRLPDDLRARVELTTLLGPGLRAGFEFHPIDLVKDVDRDTDLLTFPELTRLRGARVLCVYGSDEKRSLCREADSTLVTRVERRGKHHFDGDYLALGDLVLGALR